MIAFADLTFVGDAYQRSQWLWSYVEVAFDISAYSGTRVLLDDPALLFTSEKNVASAASTGGVEVAPYDALPLVNRFEPSGCHQMVIVEVSILT